MPSSIRPAGGPVPSGSGSQPSDDASRPPRHGTRTPWAIGGLASRRAHADPKDVEADSLANRLRHNAPLIAAAVGAGIVAAKLYPNRAASVLAEGFGLTAGTLGLHVAGEMLKPFGPPGEPAPPPHPPIGHK